MSVREWPTYLHCNPGEVSIAMIPAKTSGMMAVGVGLPNQNTLPLTVMPQSSRMDFGNSCR